MIRLGAIDDDRMLLDGFAAWLGDVEDVHLLARAATVDEFLAASPDVDVVMLDLRLQDGSVPAENVVRLVARGYRVCMVSTHHDQIDALATIRAGAEGYVTKDNDLVRLIEALRVVASGETAFSRELAFTLMQDHAPERPELSEQERAVLVAYASGLTLGAAARRAGVKPGTAKVYLDRVKAKYREAGRPAYTKLDLAERVRQDSLSYGTPS